MVSNAEKKILESYRKKLDGYVDNDSIGQVTSEDVKRFSREYITFKREIRSNKRSLYERLCKASQSIIEIKPPANLQRDIEKSIETVHLEVTPIGVASFGFLLSFLLILLALIIPLINFLIFKNLILFLPLVLIILGLVGLIQFVKIPIFMANRWRLKASNQMVLCILYVVIYMRHTSNLEHALKFAAEHIEAPLSLDLRKVFWDLETSKFSTIKESLDSYLSKWREYNLEFVSSFHLIESSLYEPTESRRMDLLDKSLEVILEGSYEKMLHYAQDLKSPITTLHMLGVILPILGLVIFPLLGAFLGGIIKWYHLAILYNILLPVLVYVIGMNTLSKRPTGQGESKVAGTLVKKQQLVFWFSFFIILLFVLVGLLPLIINLLNPGLDASLGSLGNFFGYEEGARKGTFYGPFGIGATILSFFIPLGLALGLAFYYHSKSKNLINLRNETKALEIEFSSALFQLGNRVGDGIPTELAFNKVAETLEGTPSGTFFKIVDINIRQRGMSLEQAIFNEKTGAIMKYPSPLIESSMEVLMESAKKGPKVVSTSMISIANYVDRIHKASERLKDLLAEIVSSMKAQINFLTPAIAGIVVGISSMITAVLVNLNTKFASLATDAEQVGNIGETVSELFKVEDLIPSYYFQIIVGLYVVQLAFVLTKLENSIENGDDKLNEQFMLGKNLRRSTIIYVAIALFVTVFFTILANTLLPEL